MLYVGLDVHSRQSSLCILNSSGGLVNRCEVKGPRSAVVQRLRQLNEPFSVCYEASCGYGHLYEQVRPLARHVAVAHPAKLRLIFGSKRKNNRFDAEKLAKLLLLNVVPQVHVPGVDVRAWRSLIQLRQRLLSQRVMAKNQIRAVLRENDLAGAKWLWSKKQLAWLESLDLQPGKRHPTAPKIANPEPGQSAHGLQCYWAGASAASGKCAVAVAPHSGQRSGVARRS